MRAAPVLEINKKNSVPRKTSVVAGIATAVAGAVFWPAIPFIIAGSAVGGGAMAGHSKQKESKAREDILASCMTDRGYKAYTAK
jgi:hypothetical protein